MERDIIAPRIIRLVVSMNSRFEIQSNEILLFYLFCFLLYLLIRFDLIRFVSFHSATFSVCVFVDIFNKILNSFFFSCVCIFLFCLFTDSDSLSDASSGSIVEIVQLTSLIPLLLYIEIQIFHWKWLMWTIWITE